MIEITLIPPDTVEEIVRHKRIPDAHIGRVTTPETNPTLNILHSTECFERGSGFMLHCCPYTISMERYGFERVLDDVLDYDANRRHRPFKLCLISDTLRVEFLLQEEGSQRAGRIG